MPALADMPELVSAIVLLWATAWCLKQILNAIKKL